MYRRDTVLLALENEQGSCRSAAERVSLVEHRIEDRREVTGRGIDDLQYLGGRGLLRSNASRVSVMSRAFSIAITACAAKFCSSAICLSENGRTSWRLQEITPSSAPWRRSGINRLVRTPPRSETARAIGSSTCVKSGVWTMRAPASKGAPKTGEMPIPCRRCAARSVG